MKTHSEWCNLMCFGCLSKKHVRPIKEEALIKKHFWSNFSLANPDLPKQLCMTCRFKLRNLEKGNNSEPFHNRPNYEGKLF